MAKQTRRSTGMTRSPPLAPTCVSAGAALDGEHRVEIAHEEANDVGTSGWPRAVSRVRPAARDGRCLRRRF